jgi:hypothetical protein
VGILGERKIRKHRFERKRWLALGDHRAPQLACTFEEAASYSERAINALPAVLSFLVKFVKWHIFL